MAKTPPMQKKITPEEGKRKGKGKKMKRGEKNKKTKVLIWRIHNLRFTQPSTHSPARSPAQTAAGGSGDTLPRGLAKAHLGHHVDLVGQGDDYVFIAAVLEIVGFDHFIIALDGVRVLMVLKHLF